MRKETKPYNIPVRGNFYSKLLSSKYLFVIIFIIAFLCYVRALFSDFLHYDDDVLILNNPFIKNFGLDLIKNSFGFTKITHYHPLVYLSFAAEYFFFGLNPFYYHLSNVLLHCLNSVLLFKLLEKIGLKKEICFLTALLFAIHPLHVESVAWITERKDMLCTAFYFGSIILFINWRRISKNIYYFGALALFILSCLSKAMAVTLPVLLILAEFFAAGKIKPMLKWIAPFALISFIFTVINIFVAFYKPGNNNYNFIEMVALVSYSLAFYPYKICFPVNLSVIYLYPETPGLIHRLSPIFVFIMLLLILFSKKKSVRFGFLFYLITILPVLPLVPFGISLTADRFAYIPSVGLLIVISSVIVFLYRLISEKLQAYKYALVTAFAAVFAALVILTYNRCGKWENTRTLMTDAIEYNNKNYYAFFILGNYYMAGSSFQNAVSNYQQCLNIKSDYTGAILNMGSAYFHLNNFTEAVNCFNKVIEIDPGDREAYNNLGVVYENSGELEKAIENYKKAARLGYMPAINVLKYYGRSF